MGDMRSMLTAVLLALAVTCATSQQDPVHREVIVTATVTTENGEGTAHIMIGAVPRAPFPSRPNMPAAKLAVIQMLANCKTEAFSYCGAKPMVPICPKRLAVCLVGITP